MNDIKKTHGDWGQYISIGPLRPPDTIYTITAPRPFLLLSSTLRTSHAKMSVRLLPCSLPHTSLRSCLSWLVLGFCTRRKESRSSSLSPPRSGWNTTTHIRENTEGGMFSTASEVTRYSLERCRRGERGGRREGEEGGKGKEGVGT